MYNRIKQVVSSINYFGLGLIAIVFAWTYYIITKLFYGIEHDLCPTEEDRFCSTWDDLSYALIQIIIGLSLFYLVINPLTYRPTKLLRAYIMFFVSLPFMLFGIIGTIHSGYVMGKIAEWWLIMFLGICALIVIGLIARWQERKPEEKAQPKPRRPKVYIDESQFQNPEED